MSHVTINLPVADLEASKAFYEALGYAVNPFMTDENASAISISEQASLMLLQRDYFATFVNKPVAEASTATALTIAFSVDTKAEVDEKLAVAVAAGGVDQERTLDMGFMYGQSFTDPDGHIVELVWMDPDAEESTDPSSV